MALGNKYRCCVCGKIFDFCPKCAVTQPSYDAERYCSPRHAEIFETLSKHGCGLATAEETLVTLGNVDGEKFTASIQAHIDSLKPANVEDVEPEHEIVFKKKW